MAVTNASKIAIKTTRIRGNKQPTKSVPSVSKGLLNKPESVKLDDNRDIALMLKEHIRKGFENV